LVTTHLFAVYVIDVGIGIGRIMLRIDLSYGTCEFYLINLVFDFFMAFFISLVFFLFFFVQQPGTYNYFRLTGGIDVCGRPLTPPQNLTLLKHGNFVKSIFFTIDL